MTKQLLKKSKMQHDEWEEINNRLIRTFFFKNYDGVMEFVFKVMEIAKKQNHHPNMIVNYDNVKLSIWDEEKRKVSEKCHKYALAVDKLI
jgi:4a-hydroxytetrahydrobiopterin dehydratase